VNLGGSNGLHLSWPSWATGYQVYAATNLAAPIPWQLTTNAIQSSNGTFWLDFPITNRSQQFFRLSPN
jgi:hypothetical protein